MKATPLEVMAAIARERLFQDKKHGSPELHPHPISTWLFIMEAELNEAKLACIKGGMGRDSIINEIIQIAATAVACLEQHGVDEIRGRSV
jgi:hypothetical protein